MRMRFSGSICLWLLLASSGAPARGDETDYPSFGLTVDVPIDWAPQPTKAMWQVAVWKVKAADPVEPAARVFIEAIGSNGATVQSVIEKHAESVNATTTANGKTPLDGREASSYTLASRWSSDVSEELVLERDGCVYAIGVSAANMRLAKQLQKELSGRLKFRDFESPTKQLNVGEWVTVLDRFEIRALTFMRPNVVTDGDRMELVAYNYPERRADLAMTLDILENPRGLPLRELAERFAIVAQGKDAKPLRWTECPAVLRTLVSDTYGARDPKGVKPNVPSRLAMIHVNDRQALVITTNFFASAEDRKAYEAVFESLIASLRPIPSR